ncbi:unnamed protein product [Ascophyllum nodosum]
MPGGRHGGGALAVLLLQGLRRQGSAFFTAPLLPKAGYHGVSTEGAVHFSKARYESTTSSTSGFVGTTSRMRRWLSVSTSGGAAPASGVAGLKAVAVAESTNLLSGEQPKGDKMGEYIASRGGSLPIRKILIANNGMAGTKAILSMRQWCYLELGDEKAVEFVAMATPEDLLANAEFIRLADAIVEVPGGKNVNNYANVDLIVETAVKQGVDAVWPGWGHASENPRLPTSLAAEGIKFIGPTAPVMSVLGDKIAANILAQTAKVPSIPWSGDGLEAKLTEDGTIPEEIFRKAQVTSLEEALAAANRIGYPVMVKASEGGGGKGIRMSHSDEDMRSHFVQVTNEVVGSPIFLMQLCTGARHIEVQIVGDEHGQAVAINGRDCSTQRRFQKIFEEGPPTIVPPEMFKEMERAAQRLTQNIGYRGAGTVEYLYNPTSNKFFFLELNPRLQVEHPVTEGLSLANLPSIQLQVAMGIPLHEIPDIRGFYGKVDRYGHDPIDFMTEDYAPIRNHVIAARITAENPDEARKRLQYYIALFPFLGSAIGFKPTSGTIERVKFQSTSSVWGYFSVGANGGIHEFADSQFGHLFASGPTREAARKNLVLALKEIEVQGEIRTTVEYLVQLLETDEFKANTIDTSWLDGLIREKSVGVEFEMHSVVTCAALYKAFTFCKQEMAKYVSQLEKGQTGLIGLKRMNKFPVEISYEGVKYSFTIHRQAPDTFTLSINGQDFPVKVREQKDGRLIANFQRGSRLIFGQEEAMGLRLQLDGKTVVLPNIFDPRHDHYACPKIKPGTVFELRSDITGKVVRFLQEDGADVAAGEPFVEVEAMKMIMPLRATESGKISHEMSPGSIIAAGDLLASLQLADPSRVKKILPFKGQLDLQAGSGPADDNVDAMIQRLDMAMQGFELDFDPVVARLFSLCRDADKLGRALQTQVERFLSVELLFAGKANEDAVIADLIKAHKGDPEFVVNTVQAHQALSSRTRQLNSSLRALIRFADEQGEWTPSPELQEGLEKLSSLEGPGYGEVALEAGNILRLAKAAPFEGRVNALREELFSIKPEQMAVSPSLSAGVDLLTSLFDDADPSIRAAALETYIRRVYRAHEILNIAVDAEEGGKMSVEWSFRFRDTSPQKSPIRYGQLAVLPDLKSLTLEKIESLSKVIQASKDADTGTSTDGEPVNVVHVALMKEPKSMTAGNAGGLDEVITRCEEVLTQKRAVLQDAGVRMVSVLFRPERARQPRYLSFRECMGYEEDPIRRDMRPSFPYIFELGRLAVNYKLERLPTVGRNSHIYLGVERGAAIKRSTPQTLFMRAISHRQETYSLEGANQALLMAMDELERAMLDPRVNPACSSRIFLHIMPDLTAEPREVVAEWKEVMDTMVSRHATRLLKLRVDEIEVKARISHQEDGKGKITPLRLMASSMSGQWLRTDGFEEFPDPITGVTKQWCSLTQDDGICMLNPYPASNSVQLRRAAARRIGTTYAPDFLGLMEVALIGVWSEFLAELKDAAGASGNPPFTSIPGQLFNSEELLMQPDGSLAKDFRMVGTNKVGMLAWHVMMRTPEYPEGREMVVIANDVTYQSGSFGVKEDDFFKAASEYARKQGLPRIYISSNSGARIGLVEELKPKFKVAWNDESNPAQGFKYLYLSAEDYERLAPGTVIATEVVERGEKRYALSDIIGREHGIGVENLRGSGMIAGETSRAYDEAFTLSYVTGRSVGIGAYLVRLGQRTIQMRNGPIILTGFSALNKLLGREVYTSQDQLGGPQIMHPNGVSHMEVSNDQEGVARILQWLSYVPKTSNDPPAARPVTDPVHRQVAVVPTKTPYDPRELCRGKVGSDGSSWVPGFFDRGSYQEYLSGWGKSVVVGRARLGGIPMGVINVETRLSEQIIPADPANPDSREVIQAQAGQQVWFPDSAYKTAQAINDFNRGENLPLIIFANWRGFSGGTRDMYGEILKFGAQIVDALVDYKHPVFVYIPPNGELRGGAWVVIDPTINEEVMEMYADVESRGGILEPPGICEVKFRAADQISKMHELDPVLLGLDADLKLVGSEEDEQALKQQIKAREDALLPMYMQVAHEFADLHDRSGRMKAKGVVRDILEWKTSREYFYWRVKRRLAEKKIRDVFHVADPSKTHNEITQAMQKLCPKWEDDKAVLSWADGDQSTLEAHISDIRSETARREIAARLSTLSPEQKAQVLAGL